MFWRGPATVSHRLSHNCFMSHVYFVYKYIYIYRWLSATEKDVPVFAPWCSLNISFQRVSSIKQQCFLIVIIVCLIIMVHITLYLFIFLFVYRQRERDRTDKEGGRGCEGTDQGQRLGVEESWEDLRSLMLQLLNDWQLEFNNNQRFFVYLREGIIWINILS